MSNNIILSDRAIIEINGLDRKDFLQGLITNDINKVKQNTLIYAAMLNAKGRFLYDFFIFEKDDSLFLDCLKSRRNEIFTKLKFYKLRSQIEIIRNDNFEIIQNFEDVKNNSSACLIFQDPRHKSLGHRIYKILQQECSQNKNEESLYHYQRICLKIPEGEYDLTYEKSIIAEFDFDNLNAIDYNKGCYIGQELTARTHYMGEVRKKIFHIKIANLQTIEKNSEISCADENSGIVLSSSCYKNELHALALIKITKEEGEVENDYMVLNNKITIIS